MKRENYEKGSLGESIAAKYLLEHGFKIAAKNWRTRFGELDIIATKNRCIHFVEVKLKLGDRHGSPEEMINTRKLAQITRTAQMFLLKNNKLVKRYPKSQIDAVCIVLSEGRDVERLDFYENIGG